MMYTLKFDEDFSDEYTRLIIFIKISWLKCVRLVNQVGSFFLNTLHKD